MQTLADKDKYARAKALDISKSFIVQAPAGSGKTSLLINRYLSLLAQSQAPENVLVMTFTNKAVDELKTRVNHLLNTAHNQPNLHNDSHTDYQQQTHKLAIAVLKQSTAKNWQILDYPNRLNITTIDGLCNTLVQSQSVLANLMPANVIASAYERAKLYDGAVIGVLSLIDDADYQEDIMQVLLHLDNKTSSFIALFSQMLAKRDQWLRHINTQDIAALTQTIGKIHHQYLQSIQATFQTQLPEIFTDLIAQSPNLPKQYLSFFSNFKASELTVKHLQVIADLCLIKTNTWRRTAVMGFTQNNYQQQAELLKQCQIPEKYPDFIAQLAKARQLPSIDIAATDEKTIQAIVRILRLCAAQLMVDFAKTQAVDFVAIAMGAVSVLNNDDNPNGASLYLDHYIEHILLDEFQDTSYTQFALLKALTRHWQEDSGKTLFLVGDPMQSIYRFREAQVGLFLQVQQKGIGNLSLTSLDLSYNFRSNAEVVNSNNKLFSNIFPKEDNQHTGAISYHHSLVPTTNNIPSLPTTFYGYIGYDEVAEAQQVCQIVNDIIVNTTSGSIKHIAILVRAKRHLSAIITAFNANNITYDVNNIKSILDYRHSQDLLVLCQSVLDLSDKLSWLSLLRIPWVGLTLADILLLSDSHYQTVWQAMDYYVNEYNANNDPSIALSQDGQNRLIKAWQILAPVINNRGRFSLVSIISTLVKQWQTNHYLSAHELVIQTNFLQVLSKIEHNNSVDINQLTKELDEFYEVKSSHNAQADELIKISLMTIASAKGLEFDQVILPGLGKKIANSSLGLLPMTELDTGILFANNKAANELNHNDCYQYLTELNKEQEYYESIRLLYVAMTRAKTHIYLLGHINAKDKPANKNTLLWLLWAQYQQYFIDIAEQDNHTSQAVQTAPTYLRQPFLPIQTLKKSQTSHTQDNSIVTLDDDYLSNQYHTIIGTAIHQYLEYHTLAKNLVPTEVDINRRLIELGLPSDKIPLASKQIKQTLTTLAVADFYPWLFKERSSTETESVFYLPQTNKPSKKLIIDRLFIEDDCLWIIDYKTQQPTKSQTLEEFFTQQKQAHQTQLAQYAKAVSYHYTQPIKTSLCLVSIPKLLT